MRAQIRWPHVVISTRQYVWTQFGARIMRLMQLHGRPGLTGDGYWKSGDTEAAEGEGHSTIGEVEVLFQVE